MMRWMVGSSLRLRLLVVPIAAGLLLLGVTQLRHAPADVLPEFTPPLVDIQTEALGLSAQEVEQLVTVPLEQDLLNGVAFLDQIRSQSLPGLSRIELIFQPGTDVLKARQLVQERLVQAPGGIPNVSKAPVMLQPLSSTGRVMMIGLESKDVSLIDMSVLARWKIRPRLMGVPGVANVAIWGQRERQLQVQVDPGKLQRQGISLDQVVQSTANALWVSPLSFTEASTPGTGGFIDTSNQRLGIQHISPITTARDLSRVTVEGTGARTLRLGNVSRVVEDHQPLIGDAINNNGPGLLLVVQKFPGADTREVTRQVEAALDDMRPGLSGITIDSSLYRPADFIDTATRNLGLGLLIGLVVLIVLLGLLLFDWRVALISLVTIPLSLVTAAYVLYLRGVTFNTMLLAGLAIALGVVVDDAVVDVGDIRRRLARERRAGAEGNAQRGGRLTEDAKLTSVLHASLEMRGPLLYATLIIALATAPVFFVKGLAGSFARPLAVSYLLAVGVSMVVALLVTPALALLLLGGGSGGARKSPVAGWIERVHGAALTRLLLRPRVGFALVGVIALAGIAVLPTLGGRPMLPRLQDRDLLIQWQGAPGISQPEMDRITARATQELRSIPGVRDVGAHVGRAITSDQVVNVNSGELWVRVDPKADYGRTVHAIRSAVAGYPGLTHDLVTYPEQQMRALETGSGAPLVVRVFGQDADVLQRKAEEVRRAIAGVDGVVAPRVEARATEPTVEIKVDLGAAERHRIKPGDVRRAAATLLSGITVGNLFEEQKVFDVVVWGEPATRHSLTSIQDLQIDTPGGGHVRLGDVATVLVQPDPTVINHDDVSRYLDVSAGVSGRPLGAVTRDVDQRVRAIQFPFEHHAEVLGAAAARQADARWVLSVAVAAVVGILLLLQAAFGSWRLAALVLLCLPLALVGGVLAALAAGGQITWLGSWAGLFTVLAVAVRNIMVLVRRYQALQGEEPGGLDAGLLLRGAQERSGPIVLTALATGLSLLPLVFLGDVAGLEVLRPLAIVILGGLVTATVVSLLIVPFLYQRFAPREPRPDLSETPRALSRASS
jgi:CzcA family heavy metal efflux pump